MMSNIVLILQKEHFPTTTCRATIKAAEKQQNVTSLIYILFTLINSKSRT